MKPPTPMSPDCRPEHIFNVRAVMTPSRPTTRTKKSKWRKLFTNRRCDACGERLKPVVAFKQVPIGFCPTCQEEKEL